MLNVSMGPEAGSVDFYIVWTYLMGFMVSGGRPLVGTSGIPVQGARDVIPSPHARHSGGRLQRHKSRQGPAARTVDEEENFR